jgi:Transcriptional regulators
MTSLKELANLAGVDVSTVSRALNDSPRVKPKTKELIKQLAKQYNYIPDDLARGLIGKQTFTIGVIVPEFLNTFYAEIIEGFESVLSKEGYSMLFGKSGFKSENEVTCINLFYRKRVDGIIACSISLETIDYLKKHKRNIPIVLADTFHSCAEFDSVSIDNIFGVQCVVEYLVNHGHKSIGFIGDTVVTPQRLETYKTALERYNIVAEDKYISTGVERYEQGGYLRMSELLKLDRKPSAVFAVTDSMAIGAIRAIKESGLKVPDDISIIGFDDIAVSSFMEMPLTTVLQPKFEIGRISSELLVNRINDKGSKFTQTIVLKPELIIRSTTM